MTDDIGCVVIGRNEGGRLVRCLESVLGHVSTAVYVDSGSTDGSVEFARSRGVSVVELDVSQPFTAARARNSGFHRLVQLSPSVRFVQFVDGDCEIVEGWLERAAARLNDRPELAVVCGRRRERNPEASVFNLLCDLEWDTPVGDAKACGGDAMMRVEAFQAAEGFDARLIAGEEPELCFRLRQLGYGIERLEAEMTLHDAAMSSVEQWWKRHIRGGYAFTEGAYLHGLSSERYNVVEALKILAWGGLVPATAMIGAVPTLGFSLNLFGVYPLRAARLFARYREDGLEDRKALAQAVAHSIISLPQMQGMARFLADHLQGRQTEIIEYK